MTFFSYPPVKYIKFPQNERKHTLCQVIMTKNRNTVLMHSPATGLWFYIRARACYCGVLNSSSKRTRSFPPPGFVCAFTLAHAIYSWCQISGTAEARTKAMTHCDFGKHLEGHRAARAGQPWGALALPQCCPMAPKGQHSSVIHKPDRHKSLLWEENVVSEAVWSHWRLSVPRAGVCWTLPPSQSSPQATLMLHRDRDRQGQAGIGIGTGTGRDPSSTRLIPTPGMGAHPRVQV